VLNDHSSSSPTFIADVHGDYVISLTVTDIFGAESDSDSITVSFENVKPVADAGGNQSVIVGDTIFLDGSGSYDNNFDPLSYSWSFVSIPSESLAELSDANVVNPSLIVDKPGAYVVSLVVNDTFVDSDPANVTIMAITTEEAAAITLIETVERINLLDPESLKNKNLSNALTNKINAALAMIDEGLYEDALDKLEHDILGKTNGCAEIGTPDKNDWIKTCDAQNQIYPQIVEVIELLRDII
jgi:PKD domain